MSSAENSVHLTPVGDGLLVEGSKDNSRFVMRPQSPDGWNYFVLDGGGWPFEVQVLMRRKPTPPPPPPPRRHWWQRW